MRVYTYSEARQNFSSVLEIAQRDGAVRIRRKDGRSFVLQPESSEGSPLDVEGVDLGVTGAEIVEMIREGRGAVRLTRAARPRSAWCKCRSSLPSAQVREPRRAGRTGPEVGGTLVHFDTTSHSGVLGHGRRRNDGRSARQHGCGAPWRGAGGGDGARSRRQLGELRDPDAGPWRLLRAPAGPPRRGPLRPSARAPRTRGAGGGVARVPCARSASPAPIWWAIRWALSCVSRSPPRPRSWSRASHSTAPSSSPRPAARAALAERAREARTAGMSAIADAVAAGSLGPGTAGGAAAAFVRESVLRQSPAGFAAHCVALAAARAPDHGAIRCPCLLVHGEADPVAPLAQARRLRDRIAGARLVTLPGIGHWPMVEDPRRAAELLRGHLAAASAPAPQ